MRIIIAGSRTLHPTVEDIDVGFDFVFCADDVTEVVSGCAHGVDKAGEVWAQARGKKVTRFPITPDDAKPFGSNLAPKMRNRRMAQYVGDGGPGGGGIIWWDGISGGSCDMVTRLVVRQLPVIVIPMKKRK